MPNLPRALNIWPNSTSVASFEPRRTVTVGSGVNQCTNVAAPTKSKMRTRNIPAVASFLISLRVQPPSQPPRSIWNLQPQLTVDNPRPGQRQQIFGILRKSRPACPEIMKPDSRGRAPGSRTVAHGAISVLRNAPKSDCCKPTVPPFCQLLVGRRCIEGL